MEKTAEVKVNFFRPVTEHARANMKLILTLAIIWAVAVFGFQVLLILVNKPVPEPRFTIFQTVWPEIQSPQAKQQLAQVTLAVLGKNVALQPEHKDLLQNTVSKLTLQLLPAEEQSLFQQAPLEYLANNDLHDVLGLESEGFDKLLYDLLPTSLVPVQDGALGQSIREQLPDVMQLYLVHNRSFLTDTTFIGFPFHYWYTAQFLLIMFVVLCVIYAVYIDKLHKKHNVQE